VKPILRNIKAIADDGRLTLMATDLELGIRLDQLSAIIDEPGEAILPAQKLVSILRESTDDSLAIEADENRCLIQGQFNEYEMPSENPADFPDVPQLKDGPIHQITAGVLRQMIRLTAFATAKESTKYAVTGVLWEVEGKRIRLVATDTKRLAMAEGPAVEVGELSGKGESHVVPTKAMTLLERSLQDDDETVQVCLRSNEVLFRTEKATITSRLVEGRYPPYREIIPKKTNVKVPLKVAELLTGVRQAAIMTDDETKRVGFHIAANKLTLEAQGATTGRSKVDLRLEYDAAPIDISFDPQFIVDMLKVMDEEAELTLELVDSSRPAVFRSGDYLYLVMPLSSS
jgi:DNA polymerase-3 subunit beta